ncbi:MAG: hypothetical protein R3F20_05870 [Planctomycetota bacterium]
MKSIDPKSLLIGALAAGLIAAFVTGNRLPAVSAGGSTDGNSDIVAVTGNYGSSASVLYVIDTKSRQMAVYKSSNGQSIELVAARRIEHDLKLMSYRDESGGEMNPVRLEREYLRYLSEGGPLPGTPAARGGVTPKKDGDEEKK